MNMTVNLEERALICGIAKRFISLLKNMGQTEQISIAMDLTATHTNGCPLRLKELSESDDFNFLHDVIGINQNLDRNTGKLMNCFRPRFAA
jgi:hypothetical protein